MSTTATTPTDCSPNPDPAAPRMIIWTTLRCLEFQIDQHEERYNSDGVVSWELIKHMVRLAKRQAQDEAGKIIAAEREIDQWRTRADEANAKLQETEQELQRLRQVHIESQSEELQAAQTAVALLSKQRDAARRCLGKIREQLAQIDEHGKLRLSWLQEIRLIVQQFDAADGPGLPTAGPPPVTKSLDDSTGTDGPGQS